MPDEDSDDIDDMLEIIPIPAFHDNYIWALINPAQRVALVVDPGDAAPVAAFLRARELRLLAVLITHHHADHTGGLLALQRDFEAEVYGPKNEAIEGVAHLCGEGDLVRLADQGFVDFRVIEIPGHTRGHVAFVHDDFVFCGDTLFALGCGRLFEGTPEQMHQSLQRLAALPPSTRVYCTHEYTASNLKFALHVETHNRALNERAFEIAATRAAGQPTLPTTIADELATNPFLRGQIEEVRHSAERFAGRSLHTELEVFTALRAWKNDFR